MWDCLDDKAEVPSFVFARLTEFVQSYSKLPNPAKLTIAKIVSHSECLANKNTPVEVDLLIYYYGLSEKEQSELYDMLHIINNCELGEIHEKNHKMYECGEEACIEFDKFFRLKWKSFDLGIDIISALKYYYLKQFSLENLFNAFMLADFNLVD